MCFFFILKVFLTGTETTESLVKNTLVVFSLKNQDIGKCTCTRKGDENKHYIPLTQRKLWIISYTICFLNIFYTLSWLFTGTVYLIYQYIWTYFYDNTFVYNLILNGHIAFQYLNMLLGFPCGTSGKKKNHLPMQERQKMQVQSLGWEKIPGIMYKIKENKKN